MSKLLAVYVGQASQVNLEVGLQKGIWGFKEHAAPISERLKPGDYIILGTGYTGGAPRTDQPNWERNNLQRAILGRVTSELFKSTDVVWPDEQAMPEQERYQYRLTFEKVEEFQSLALGDPAVMRRPLSDALRRSGCNAGRGNVVDLSDLSVFGGDPEEAEEDLDDIAAFRRILAQYVSEKIVFRSTERGVAYAISEADGGGYQVDRLDADQPAAVGIGKFSENLANLRSHGGKLPFDAFDNTVARKNAFLQAECLALSADRKTIFDVRNADARLKVFEELLKNLAVAKSEDGPKLYKPAMLACVIDAIENGSLASNEITFDFIAARFLEKMRRLGVEVTHENAAQPFFHLSGDLFWLHAVHDTRDPMRADNVSPAAARTKVKYALLKKTFWNLLQDPAARMRVLEVLDEEWLKSKRSIKFWWVNQGRSFDAERPGGYIQAPKEIPDETIKFYWANVALVKPGDIVFHYAKPGIRAISIVRGNPFDVDIGIVPGDDYPGRLRVRAEVEYHDLDPLLNLDLISAELANVKGDYRPIDKNGGVNQGYLFSISDDELQIIISQLVLSQLPEELRIALPVTREIKPPSPMLTPSFLQDASKAIRSSGLIFDDTLLRRFACSLLAKPFVVLTGTSGTGKTQLALKFAEWLVGDNGYELVPVGADWTDNRQVLGHHNPFDKEFISTRILDLMLRAKDAPERPFFLILDEMNLSHVERYFADFLSAMESGGSISLHRNGTEVKTAKEVPIPEQIEIPKNLFVIGTVNIDETTYMFSPKVLDRANVIEFSLRKKELVDFMESDVIGLKVPNPALTTLAESFMSSAAKRRLKDDLPETTGEKNIRKTIIDLFSLLENTGMEFGFRTPTEILRFCQISHELSEPSSWKWQDTCDFQILQKILPKLHGSRRKIEGLLAALECYCNDPDDLPRAQKILAGETSSKPDTAKASSPVFTKSHQKLHRMLNVVRRDQFVSFIQ